MELDILHRAVAHAQIVEFYGAFFVEGSVYYCMEYMDAGSMDKLYLPPSLHVMPEPVLARIGWSMVSGLHFLKESLNIIHRDVKPTNVLVNMKGEIKLCDFGVSGELEKSLAKTNIGCQSYMAPERIDPQFQASGPAGSRASGNAAASATSKAGTGGTYTVAADVWSLGLSLVEIAKGAYPYPMITHANVFAQLQAIVWGDTPRLPSTADSDSDSDSGPAPARNAAQGQDGASETSDGPNYESKATSGHDPWQDEQDSLHDADAEGTTCPPAVQKERYSSLAQDFVSQCLVKNPHQRASYATLLQHPWLVADRQLAASEKDVNMAAWVRDTLETKQALAHTPLPG